MLSRKSRYSNKKTAKLYISYFVVVQYFNPKEILSFSNAFDKTYNKIRNKHYRIYNANCYILQNPLHIHQTPSFH